MGPRAKRPDFGPLDEFGEPTTAAGRATRAMWERRGDVENESRREKEFERESKWWTAMEQRDSEDF